MTEQPKELIKIPSECLRFVSPSWGSRYFATNQMIDRIVREVCAEGVWAVPNDGFLSNTLKREIMRRLYAKKGLSMKTQDLIGANWFHHHVLVCMQSAVYLKNCPIRQDSSLLPLAG